MLKALILTSNSVRHEYFANIIASNFKVVGIISEPKSNYFTKQINESLLVKKHFEDLAKYERAYLGSFSSFPQVETLRINKSEINSAETLTWAKSRNANVVFLFGTGILSEDWLNAFPQKIINLHLGYSPRYRGSATLFWPFFNDEVEYIGATIHLAEKKVDAGAILQIIKPKILKDDNYYDINFKTIKVSIDSIANIANSFFIGDILPVIQSQEEQKYLYLKRDFTEDALLKVLARYGEKKIAPISR